MPVIYVISSDEILRIMRLSRGVPDCNMSQRATNAFSLMTRLLFAVV